VSDDASTAKRWIALLLLASGCCTGADGYLTFGLGAGSGTSSPAWGSTVTFRAAQRPTVSATWRPEHPLAGAPVEVFVEGSLAPVALACDERRINNATREGCGFSDEVTCPLGALPPGRYALVHRRAHGNGDALNCGDACPWTTFQGEAALRLTLVIDPP
jgi:hypothetical protein